MFAIEIAIISMIIDNIQQESGLCAFFEENRQVAAVPTGNPVNATNPANIGSRND
jgi:hypothetical protein